MTTRKILAVGYPEAKHFALNDETKVRRLVVWLEDNIFNTELPQDFLDNLRNVSHPQWTQLFQEYLITCQCPVDPVAERTAAIDWLLREALRLIAPLQNGNAAGDQAMSNGDGQATTIDPTSPEFQQGVNKLAAMLKMPTHPDASVTFKAVANLMERLAGGNEYHGSNDPSAFQVTLNEIALGFETADKGLTDACKILRLLHIDQMRKLQTQMDHALVAVQSITADPKTNSDLGKIGF
ncbi:hypothetical protein RvY_10255 [Ramazzottius varieornatus]|uniref:RNA transcription, translation and transport factor protein n=1 Tax=Ramazzottius varieornatus TaxID=947166 RepID=A0A1D1VJY0_RAMVA|nr:hypothetical protein RvY_10255 [Ramazzottius varieornatus]